MVHGRPTAAVFRTGYSCSKPREAENPARALIRQPSLLVLEWNSIHPDGAEIRTMKKVLTYGTFDLLHRGHINLLRRARELGDHLVVGLSTDSFNAIKDKKAFYAYEERRLVLEAIRYVDQVIPEENWEQKADDIRNHGIDILVMGDDWQGRFDHLSGLCEVVYLPRTTGISTSMVKASLRVGEASNVEYDD